MQKFAVYGWMALASATLVWGQEQPAGDPPSRVARLNYVNGNVSFRPANVEDWSPATLNYPLTTGDHLWTDEQAGAEMHIDSAALRIAGATSFAVLNIDDRSTQVSVAQGFVNVRLRRLENGETFEVDTPNGAISILRPGDYRIGVDPGANSTTVFVRSGEAEVIGGDKTFPVAAGQPVRFIGTDRVDAESLEPPSPDQWDEWCATRDREDDRAVQAVEPYVGREMIGAEDLASNGDWRDDPTYGHYWVPTRVVAGWEPYRYGHWAFVVPWGWTWIDDAPWGFAPFHYGRWAMIGGGWGWVPGVVVRRPVYAPALVAFVGGEHFGAAIGIGGIGVTAWIPLGPREVYRPYYHVSDRYVRQVNISHVNVTNINVTNINVSNTTYMNRTHVTAVRQDTFVGARPVAGSFVRVPPNAMNNVQRVDVMNTRPARDAYMGRQAGGMRVATPPTTVVNRPMIVRSAPPERARVSVPVHVSQPGVRVDPGGYRPAYNARPQIDTTRPQRSPLENTRPLAPQYPPAQNTRPQYPQRDNIQPQRPVENTRPQYQTPATPPQYPAQNTRPQYQTPVTPPQRPPVENTRPQYPQRDNTQPQRPVENTRPQYQTPATPPQYPPAQNTRPQYQTPATPPQRPPVENTRPQYQTPAAPPQRPPVENNRPIYQQRENTRQYQAPAAPPQRPPVENTRPIAPPPQQERHAAPPPPPPQQRVQEHDKTSTEEKKKKQ